MSQTPGGATFFRAKPSGQRRYLQLVENYWDQGRTKQRVLATLGRLDQLQQSGQLDALLASGLRLARRALLLTAHRDGQLPAITTRRIGPALIFDRLWQLTGCRDVLTALLADRRLEFAVERAVFLTVLHRLFAPGSDRAADQWRVDYLIDGTDGLQLHHLYRAMAWLGEELPQDQQQGSTRLVPRCTKDVIEEEVFGRRCDLFTQLDVVFFDTTSLYFEGDGGEELGQYGHSKDHRPDEKQMVVGAVLDGTGRPICREPWPGNTADVTALIPVVDRLWRKFRIRQVCVVADRGMISQDTISDLGQQGWPYIPGARVRRQKEVREQVPADGGRFHVAHGPRQKASDPAPLKVKEVKIEGRRYVVCVNEGEVESDRVRRGEILAGLREQPGRGDKSPAGNKGYRRHLKVEGEGHFAADEAKIAEEARYDGTWVLRTNAELATAEVALQFKQQWMAGHWFRCCKSLLETRPIYRKRDETTRGHVFCSFLALLLRHELQARLKARGYEVEWAEVVRDLERVQYVEVAQGDKRFQLRTELQGSAGHVFQAVGVAVPPTVQQLS